MWFNLCLKKSHMIRNKNKADKLEQQKDFKNGTNLDYLGTISHYHTTSSFLSKVHKLKTTS